jgi:hypothetical protein
MYTQLELEVLDVVIVPPNRSKVNLGLALLAPHVSIVGYQNVEDGWELMLEGPVSEVTEFINSWKEKAHE